MAAVLAVVLAALLMLVAGCGWPRDAGSTLADVRDGVLRVGVTENPPWTRVADDGAVSGAEVHLVERLAARLGARVEWHPGSESTLMAALKDRVLDLIVGGLDAKAPWTKQASLTKSFVTMRTVVAVPAGVAAPTNLAGVRVAVPAESPRSPPSSVRTLYRCPYRRSPALRRTRSSWVSGDSPRWGCAAPPTR